jgi:hypothetical protein
LLVLYSTIPKSARSTIAFGIATTLLRQRVHNFNCPWLTRVVASALGLSF